MMSCTINYIGFYRNIFLVVGKMSTKKVDINQGFGAQMCSGGGQFSTVITEDGKLSTSKVGMI